MTESVVSLLQSLLRQPTVGGTLAILERMLRQEQFETEILTFHGISNLYATRCRTKCSSGLVFLGHADVVSVGDVEEDGSAQGWVVPPFAGFCDRTTVFGRGAVDMKGAIACFLEALRRVPSLDLDVVISGDEEGDGVWGTPAVLDELRQQGRLPSWEFVLIGEPTSTSVLGDGVKIGCRGSCNITVTVTGRGGHVAYPQFLANPVVGLSRLLCRLQEEPLGERDELFGVSHAEVTHVSSPPSACNVVPEVATACFNIRYNPSLTPEGIRKHLAKMASELSGFDIDFVYDVQSRPFRSPPSPYHDLLSEVIREVTGQVPQVSALGASSDARFLSATQPFAELGLSIHQAHKVNEQVSIADLLALTSIYETFLKRLV